MGSDILKRLMLEFVGSLSYLLVGCIIELIVVHFLPIDFFVLKIVIIALGFSASFGIIYSLCNLKCNVDINPLFTFATWLKSDISFYKMLSTIFIQILGAVEAGFIILLFFSSIFDSLTLGVGNNLLFSASFNKIVLGEFLGSFIFTFFYFFSKHTNYSVKFRGLVLGLLLFLLLFVLIPFTGGSVNPARGFVANLFVNFDMCCQLGFYLVSSLAGALFSTIIYHFLSYHHNSVS